MGPVHPFAEIEDHYRLVKEDGSPAWGHDENYAIFGSFPPGDRPIRNSSYQVLEESVAHDPPIVQSHTRTLFTLTRQSFDALIQQGLPWEIVRLLRGLQDIEFSSEDALLDAGQQAIFPTSFEPYADLIVASVEKRQIQESESTGGAAAHYLDIHDPEIFYVLTQESFNTLRARPIDDPDHIPEDILSCLENEFKDHEVPEGLHSVGMKWAVHDYLEGEACGTLGDTLIEHYSNAAQRASEFRHYYQDRNFRSGKPYLLHRGHPFSHPNHVFIQYWMYSTASHMPYGIPVLGGNFNHEADWEMVQMTLRLTDPEMPARKTTWLLPYAATAAQHYYGQTLPWRIDEDKNGPLILNQRYVATEEYGNRVKVFIAENAHATYFRDKVICTEDGKVGTQIQYQSSCSILDGDAYDMITEPVRRIDYKLLSLDLLDNSGIFDWPGNWGKDKIVGPDIPGPYYRYVKDDNIKRDDNIKTFRMALRPERFHNQCRKHLEQELTELLP